MSVTPQCVGFKAKEIVREYSLLVRESSIEPHEIIFTIRNKAFTSRRLSFQNARYLLAQATSRARRFRK